MGHFIATRRLHYFYELFEQAGNVRFNFIKSTIHSLQEAGVIK